MPPFRYEIVKGVGPPLFPLATMVFGAETPVFVVLLVTAEVLTGLVVVQEKFMEHPLPPKPITQEEDAGVRVPDIGEGAAHELPFQTSGEVHVLHVGGLLAPLPQLPGDTVTVALTGVLVPPTLVQVRVYVYVLTVFSTPWD